MGTKFVKSNTILLVGIIIYLAHFASKFYFFKWEKWFSEKLSAYKVGKISSYTTEYPEKFFGIFWYNLGLC